ncbi:putative methyltransferase isoform 3-T8 [Ammospiza maritima maritima]
MEAEQPFISRCISVSLHKPTGGTGKGARSSPGSAWGASSPSMATQMFEGRGHAAVYQKYRFAPGKELKHTILSYLREKKAIPAELAVDVGCGSGQGTHFLGEHFKKVVGTDISEAQIQEAKATPCMPNISYLFADLFACAVFLLGKNIFLFECWDEILKYSSDRVKFVLDDYKAIFESLPFPDKKRITDIYDPIPMTVEGVVGYMESTSSYQTFKKNDPAVATSLLQETEKRMLETMGVSSRETPVEFLVRHICVLGCKGR